MFIGRMYSGEVIRLLINRNGNGYVWLSVCGISHVCRPNDCYTRELSMDVDYSMVF